MKKIKAFFANIWNWIKSLFGSDKKAVSTPTPKEPLVGAELAKELNKQTTPLSGAALAEQLNKQSPAAAPAPKTKKAVTKKTSKRSK